MKQWSSSSPLTRKLMLRMTVQTQGQFSPWMPDLTLHSKASTCHNLVGKLCE